MHLELVVVIAVAAGLVVLGIMFLRRAKSRRSPVAQLRAEYARLVNLPPAQAYESLERHVERAMDKHPGQPMEWYLRSIIEELKRDRR